MIALGEYRDEPGRSREDVVMCNRIWDRCNELYRNLTQELRRKPNE